MSIGDRIKEQRAKLGYSQQQLSNELGVSIDTVKSLEINRAKPSVETLNKLANLFNCSTDYLLGRDELIDSWASLKSSYLETARKVSRWDPVIGKELIELIDTLPNDDTPLNLYDDETLVTYTRPVSEKMKEGMLSLQEKAERNIKDIQSGQKPSFLPQDNNKDTPD